MTIHGAKKGGGKQRQPIIAPDSAQSKTFISIMYGLGEGEIAGLADGYKSVYLDDTPLQNDDGEFNFAGVKVDFRAGTNDQEYIDGFADVASETNVGVELKHGTPWVKSFNNLDLDALRVRIKWGALRQQNRENGDVVGVKIDYAIDVKTDNGGWVEALNTSINAKTSNAYERSHRIDLPDAQQGWAVRVRRITPDSTSELVSDTMYISAITEVIDLKLRYPNTALLGLRYDAEQFSNVAKMAARCRGLIIKVPTNYNPITRTYDGLWDGQFKMAYTNNPAWVYYDLCTAERYGLGSRLTEYMIDKWSLYRLAQYCDHMVDDGMGGQEPRFTVNVYIQSADGAFELLSRLAGVFRAISYWDGTSIVLDADIPQDSIYSFSRANVIDGIFEYTGTRARDRHTVAKVAWDNPANHFKTEYEYVRDEKAIAKFGVRVADIQAWGCTSKGQAQRAGLWALKSEQLETRMVTFKVGLDGYIPAPAKVIEISDELFAGRATGGRVLAINKTKTVITLDRAITAKAGDTLVINGDDGTSQRRQISGVNGDNVTVTKPFSDISEQNVWVLDSQDLATMKFRVLSVTADDNHEFTITAVQYNPVKYDAIDTGAVASERPISVINPTVQAPTKSVNLSSYHTVNQGVTVTTLVIGWEQVTGAVKYAVEWRKDNGNWQSLPPTGTNSIEITGVYAGQYEARVTAISAFGQASLATHSNLTQIQGKQGKPPRPINFTAQGVLFGMNLGWNFAKGSGDTNYTEIQVSPDGRSNIATLGTFAYPTNKHEITGLQGNLTQFYRARIVDKLGNTSDWTDWASGTTSANADKVLDILSGQISQSHLDQSLRTPIGKIGTIESNISKINVDLPELNQSIADAQSTLNTAVASIDTEKKRLSSAIVDINTLKQSNNAKTQEIANLTQTVNGHTSQVRELGVTTGDLSQKYSQLKTTSDTANSEITAIKQTQSGQATSVERIRSELVGKASSADLQNIRQTLANADSSLSQRINTLQSDYNGNKAGVAVQLKTLSDKDNATASQISRLNSQIANKASSADLQSVQRTLANADSSLSQRINTLQSDYNGNKAGVAVQLKTLSDKDNATASQISRLNSQIANKASSADLQNIRQTLANADSSLSQRINTLQSDYNGNKAGVAVQLKTLSDKDNATASQISRLNSQIANKASSADLQSVQRTLTSKERSLSQRINTVQTTLNGQTASIQQHAQSLNGLLAQWTLKVQSGGVVSGIGLASNNGVSDFAVIADKFYVASPQGDKKPMFTVTTRPTTLNGTTVPAVVSLNGDLIGNGTISGDKIRANTQITAPNIRGGSINIGNNFSVDNQGNLNANSGVFRGQVFADKITGQIDVESLKSSAVALGYDTYISDNYHASEPHQFDKTFKASYPSHGSITQSLGFNNENIGSIMYEMRVFCKRAITVKQKLHTVDDKLYCYVNGSSAFGYHSVHNGYDDEDEIPLPFGRGRINTEISLPLRQGLNTIQFVLNNSGGGICQVILIGDFIDNNIIKFA
ncbi:tail protein [Moraxella phage Mcat5]|nr:tail protein [Moraxella phage Mcat5]